MLSGDTDPTLNYESARFSPFTWRSLPSSPHFQYGGGFNRPFHSHSISAMENTTASQIVSSCIRHMSTKRETHIKYQFSLVIEFGRFKLWNHGFDGPWDETSGTVSSVLDEVLSYSICLKEPTIVLLASFVSCLLMKEFGHGLSFTPNLESFH